MNKVYQIFTKKQIAHVDIDATKWLNRLMAFTKSDTNFLVKHFVTKTEFNERINELEDKINQRINHLPTKDEFYKSMDRIMKELETIREEQILTPSHSDLANLEERVEILEKQILHSGN